MSTTLSPKKTREYQHHHFDSTIWNDFEFRDDDIIRTHARSGTTWVQQIVSRLLFNGEEALEVAAMSPWMDLRVPLKEVKLLHPHHPPQADQLALRSLDEGGAPKGLKIRPVKGNSQKLELRMGRPAERLGTRRNGASSLHSRLTRSNLPPLIAMTPLLRTIAGSVLVSSWLTLSSPAFQIFVNDPGSGTATLEVESNDTISTVMSTYSLSSGLPTGIQALYFGGQLLDPINTLADYNIQKETTLQFEFLVNDQALGSTVWGADKTIDVVIRDLDLSGGTGWSHFSITGDLDIQATALAPVTIRLWSSTPLHMGTGEAAGWNPASSYSLEIASVTGSQQGFSPDAFLIDTSHFLNSHDPPEFAISGGSIVLTYGAIPEPASTFLILSAALCFFFRRGRSRRRQSE